MDEWAVNSIPSAHLRVRCTPHMGPAQYVDMG